MSSHVMSREAGGGRVLFELPKYWGYFCAGGLFLAIYFVTFFNDKSDLFLNISARVVY